MKSCIILTSHKIIEGDLGGPCSMHGRDDNFIQNFSKENQKARGHLEVVGVDAMISLEYI
jgi:hypothetical protein